MTRLEKIYIWVLAVIFAGIVVHAPLTVWLGTKFPQHSLLIKSWKELLMLALIPVACVLVSRYKLWPRLVKDWLFRLIVGYALLHFILVAVLYQGAISVLAGLAIDLRYILFFSLVYVALLVLPAARQLLLKIAIIGAYIVVGFATLQLFLPPDILVALGYSTSTIAPYLTVDKNPDYIRVNSTLRGPNPLGAYAGIVLAGVTAFIARQKLRIGRQAAMVALLAMCGVVALWISYSRSALVGALVAVGIVLLATVARTFSRRAWIVSIALLCALVGGLLLARSSAFVANVFYHDNPGGGSTINSNEDHFESLDVGWQRMLQQPLGGGVGSTGSASLSGGEPLVIENQYLFTAHETGWLGVALFMAIFFAVLNRLWQNRQDWLALSLFASGAGLALIGLLLPVWADDTVSIIWWGLAAIALAQGGNYGRKKTKQKTT